jgi:hypothetical protein
MPKKQNVPASGMKIYSLSEKRHYDISELSGVKVVKSGNRHRIVGVTPGGKSVSRFLSKEMAGSGLLGSLIGMPDGIPGLSTLPIIGALF